MSAAAAGRIWSTWPEKVRKGYGRTLIFAAGARTDIGEITVGNENAGFHRAMIGEPAELITGREKLARRADRLPEL